MSSAVRDEFPGRGKEYKKSAEETMARVGSTVDSNVEEGLHFHHLPYILLALLTPLSRQATDLGGCSEVRRSQGKGQAQCHGQNRRG